VRLVQGYGLTETSPIISCNSLEDDDPASVGRALEGVETRIGEDDELLTRSPSVMLGYWNRESATADTIDSDGWLHTGDKVRIEDGRIYITGRLKDIIVLSNGEKIPPNDMEIAIATDSLLEQVMVIGEGRPFLSALVALNPEQVPDLAAKLELDPDSADLLENQALHDHILERIKKTLHSFPGYAKILSVRFVEEPWTVDNALMTPTLKLRRAHILQKHAPLVEQMYEGH
jgi:long-chain acyl-CoA synthetase